VDCIQRPCAADETEAAEASDALRQPSSDNFINAGATCDSSPPPCSEGSWCLDGDLGVYCQRYELVMSSEEVRSTGFRFASHFCTYFTRIRAPAPAAYRRAGPKRPRRTGVSHHCVLGLFANLGSLIYIFILALAKASPGKRNASG